MHDPFIVHTYMLHYFNSEDSDSDFAFYSRSKCILGLSLWQYVTTTDEAHKLTLSKKYLLFLH